MDSSATIMAGSRLCIAQVTNCWQWSTSRWIRSLNGRYTGYGVGWQSNWAQVKCARHDNHHVMADPYKIERKRSWRPKRANTFAQHLDDCYWQEVLRSTRCSHVVGRFKSTMVSGREIISLIRDLKVRGAYKFHKCFQSAISYTGFEQRCQRWWFLWRVAMFACWCNRLRRQAILSGPRFHEIQISKNYYSGRWVVLELKSDLSNVGDMIYRH